jgi:hypothetical protein
LKSKKRFLYIARGLVIALLPVVIIIVLLFTKYRFNMLFKIGVAFYLIYQLPYLLISHEIRYQYVLLTLQALFYILFAEFILDKFNTIKVNSTNKQGISNKTSGYHQSP